METFKSLEGRLKYFLGMVNFKKDKDSKERDLAILSSLKE